MGLRGVPVVMYHGVGPDRPGWPWNHVLMPADLFERHMSILRDRGWTAITLAELHRHMVEGVPLAPRSVVLTFDDGYLDNWVYAFPIIRKYGHRAVIWVSTDFVDPAIAPRPTLDDVWAGRLTERELDPRGYLSWEEMRRMVASGFIEIQSHAQTHTWYASGSNIVDFHRPAGVDGYDPPLWLGWNEFPDRKFESMNVRLSELVPYGRPIYEHGKSLAVKRYFEDPRLSARLVDRVARGGGTAFFDSTGWREELRAIVRDFGPRSDRMETQEEYEERVRSELVESRRIIEENLRTRVEYLCWPGGGRSSVTFRIAEEAGYRATTTHFQDHTRRNVYGQNPREISRIGCGSPWVWRGRVFRRTSPEFFMAGLEVFAGEKNSIWKLRGYKLAYIVARVFRGMK
jgi:peptidoglycan/xylan/chitin deacetylase (PgdA/CDA1 family)